MRELGFSHFTSVHASTISNASLPSCVAAISSLEATSALPSTACSSLPTTAASSVGPSGPCTGLHRGRHPSKRRTCSGPSAHSRRLPLLLNWKCCSAEWEFLVARHGLPQSRHTKCGTQRTLHRAATQTPHKVSYSNSRKRQSQAVTLGCLVFVVQAHSMVCELRLCNTRYVDSSWRAQTCHLTDARALDAFVQNTREKPFQLLLLRRLALAAVHRVTTPAVTGHCSKAPLYRNRCTTNYRST